MITASSSNRLKARKVNSLSNNLIWRSSRLLDRRDRKKAFLIFLAYALMGFFDVLAVFTIGIIGSLAVSGVASTKPGNRVTWLLTFLNLGEIGRAHV